MPTILIADDDARLRKSLRQRLEQDGHVVIEAHSGWQALRELQGGITPNLVVLDLQMPGLSGGEVLMEIRRHHASLPVVMFSASIGTPDLDELLLAFGATRLFPKSEMNALVREVSNLLNPHQKETP